MFAILIDLSYILITMITSKDYSIPGFERLPKGKLLNQFVDFDDPIGVAYERCVGYFKDFHVHDRVNLTFPRSAAVIDFTTCNPKEQFLVDARSILWMPAQIEHSQDSRSLIYDNLAIFPTHEVLTQIQNNFNERYGLATRLPDETIKKTRSVLLQELLNEYFVERVLERKTAKKLIHLSHQIIEETLRIILCPKRSSEAEDGKMALENFDSDPQVARAIRFIEANLFDNLSSAAIAKQSGLSLATLFRRFSAQIGMSPGEYMTSRRLDESLSLLKSGSYNISDIAAIIGYSDLAAFSKAFKKKFGKAPKLL